MNQLLTAEQRLALRLARQIRLNIALNWRKDCFFPIAVRLWATADKANVREATMGFLSILG